MLYILYALTAAAFIGVVFTLIAGGVAMQSKADGARERSNKWMQRRIILQALAIGLLFATIYVRSRGA